jgi:hypothetical protein
MSCTWYNPELPISSNGSSCEGCNGTQYDVTVQNNTLFTLNSVYVSNIPIDLLADEIQAAELPEPLPPGRLGKLVTNEFYNDSSKFADYDKYLPKPTSPMTLSFTDTGNSNPVNMIIRIGSTCSGSVSRTEGGITYGVTWTLNCYPDYTSRLRGKTPPREVFTINTNNPTLRLVITRTPQR